jgi:hypothetical protein
MFLRVEMAILSVADPWAGSFGQVHLGRFNCGTHSGGTEALVGIMAAD